MLNIASHQHPSERILAIEDSLYQRWTRTGILLRKFETTRFWAFLRTSRNIRIMNVCLGHERPSHSAPVPTIVRSCPIADKMLRCRERSDVPLATNAPQQTASLFDHLIGGHLQHKRDCQ